MKIAIPLFALLLAGPAVGTSEEQQSQPAPVPSPFDIPALEGLDHPMLALSENCRDTIRQVRQERGLPLLDRHAADPEEPILFRALDYDVDGCDVLLVDNEDIRPLPAPQDGPLLQRAQ